MAKAALRCDISSMHSLSISMATVIARCVGSGSTGSVGLSCLLPVGVDGFHGVQPVPPC
nr:hypothetical protein CPGR_01297 [Mycolicibacter nonchromogenicus]